MDEKTTFKLNIAETTMLSQFSQQINALQAQMDAVLADIAKSRGVVAKSIEIQCDPEYKELTVTTKWS